MAASVLSGSRRLQEKLRAGLERWLTTVSTLKAELQRMAEKQEAMSRERVNHWNNEITRLERELTEAKQDPQTVSEYVQAAKLEAEYKTVLINAWPATALYKQLSYLSTAFLGSGSAAYLLSPPTIGRWESFTPSVFLWALGFGLLTISLWGLRKHDRKKFSFFADHFGVDPQYRP